MKRETLVSQDLQVCLDSLVLLEEMDSQAFLDQRVNQAVLLSRGKGVFLETLGCLGFLEIEGQRGLLDLVHKGLLVKKAFKVFLGEQDPLEGQDQKVNLVKPLQKQGCQASLVPPAEMANLGFQVILDHQANLDCQGPQVQRVIQVHPPLVFQAHRGLKVSMGCQVSLDHQEPPEDPVKMGHLGRPEFQDRRETVDLVYQDPLGHQGLQVLKVHRDLKVILAFREVLAFQDVQVLMDSQGLKVMWEHQASLG